MAEQHKDELHKKPRIHHPYVPWPFQPPAPPPMHPCLDKLPWESHKMLAEAGRQLAHYHRWETEKKARSDAQEAGLSGLGTKSGAKSFLQSVADNIVAGVDASVTSVSNDMQIARAREEQRKSAHRFAKYFPLITGERCWQSYDCRLVNGKVGELGEVYISDGSLAFSTEHCNKSRIVKFAVPLKHIVSIRRGTARHGHKHREEAPILYLIPEGDTQTEVDGYQVFTDDARVHVFYHFVGSLHSHFFNVLDHAWRSRVNPVQVQYAVPAPIVMQPYVEYKAPPPVLQDVQPLVPMSVKEQKLVEANALHASSAGQKRDDEGVSTNPFVDNNNNYNPFSQPQDVHPTPVPLDYRSNSGPPPPVPSRAHKPATYGHQEPTFQNPYPQPPPGANPYLQPQYHDQQPPQ